MDLFRRRGKRRRDAGDGPLVLVADDDDLIRRLVRTALERQNHRVLVCQSGEEALAVCRHERPSVAVLDWMMPGMQGPEVCRKLKEDVDTASTRVVLMTSRSVDTDVEAAFAKGADDYVTKPFHVDDLVRVVSAQLGLPKSS